MIQFMCLGCKTSYEVDNSFAGQEVECPNCKTRFIIPAQPEVPPAPEVRNWFYAKDNQQYGPVEEEIIVKMLFNGELASDAMVWMEDLKEWTAARSIPALNKNLAKAPPPLPVPTVSAQPPPIAAYSGGNISTNSVANIWVPEICPWIRFWARMIDYTLWVIALLAFNKLIRIDSVLGILIWQRLYYIFVEALMLSSWGTTPGKMLLGVKVRKENGTKLNYPEALNRSFRVWWCGEGLGIPFVALIANLFAYRRIVRDGKTSWDRDGKLVVSHQALGLGRKFTTPMRWIKYFKEWTTTSMKYIYDHQSRFRVQFGAHKMKYSLYAFIILLVVGITLLIFMSETKDPVAQFKIGQSYALGDGVPKNTAEAVKWYRKAAEQGHLDAQFTLGNCYKNGDGLTKDMSEAVKWYRKAAEQGHLDAQFTLGNCYKNGGGLTKDMSEAVKWYRKAAEQGLAKAQYNLGCCYYNGECVTIDKTEAVKWWQKAAAQDLAAAQLQLGLCYYNGVGVKQDKTEAEKWVSGAAAQRYKNAKSLLEFLKH